MYVTGVAHHLPKREDWCRSTHLPRYSSTRGPNWDRLVKSIVAALLLRRRSSGVLASLPLSSREFSAASTTGAGAVGAPTPVQKLSARSTPRVDWIAGPPTFLSQGKAHIHDRILIGYFKSKASPCAPSSGTLRHHVCTAGFQCQSSQPAMQCTVHAGGTSS